MLVNFWTAQLGASNQKRPVILQSQLPPQLYTINTMSVGVGVDRVILKHAQQRRTVSDNTVSAVFALGDKHTLRSSFSSGEADSGVGVSVATSEYKLVSTLKRVTSSDDIVSAVFKLNDAHTLRMVGLHGRGDANTKISVAVGDFKLTYSKE